MPWTPYADWIYAVVSSTGLLLCVWLVLRPRSWRPLHRGRGPSGPAGSGRSWSGSGCAVVTWVSRPGFRRLPGSGFPAVGLRPQLDALKPPEPEDPKGIPPAW